MRQIVKNIFAAIAFCLFLPQAASAQNKEQLNQQIRGTVTDMASGEPLYAVNVVLNASQTGAITDEKGMFAISNVPIGRHTVSATYIGYETAIIKEVMVGSAKEVFLEISLTEKITELGEVVIRPKINKAESQNEMVTLGARMLSVEEASRFAGGMDDPARLVSAYPGIASPSISNN